MRRVSSALLLGVLLLCTLLNAAQSIPSIVGTWHLDEVRSGQAREVWFSTRTRKFVIEQTQRLLRIDAGGSIADVHTPLLYNLDGQEITTINDSIGDIAGWVRKVRTKAMFDGARVVTETSHVIEANGHDNASVVVVLTFTLLSNGSEMQVERTGFRPNPPVSLHGRPYRQEDDLLYRKDFAIYVKAAH